MKTLKNKILSGFLSLAMLISPLSSVAFAEGADTTADTPSVVYTFDASTFPIESGTTASVSVSDYGIIDKYILLQKRGPQAALFFRSDAARRARVYA